MVDLRPFAQRLQAADISNPWRELRKLVAFVTGKISLPGTTADLSQLEAEALDTVVKRRAAHEPLTKIKGEASFWKHQFLTTRDTLDPRPESELFVETVLNLIPDRQTPFSLLDLGTGTGCLLLSCLDEYPQAHGVGVDLSPAALSVARANADRLGIQTAHFLISDWNRDVEGRFDVVLSNPPYIRLGETLDAEVLFDPALALFGGEDGLEAYRALFRTLASSLKPQSLVLLEIGFGQKESVVELAYTHHLTLVKTIPDWQEIPRLLVFTPLQTDFSIDSSR